MKPLVSSVADDPYRLLGACIRRHRHRLEMTLEELAQASGLGPSFIGQIERNAKKCSLRTIGKIADGLGVPIHRLFVLERSVVDRSGGRVAALFRAHPGPERRFLMSALRDLSKRLKQTRIRD